MVRSFVIGLGGREGEGEGERERERVGLTPIVQKMMVNKFTWFNM